MVTSTYQNSVRNILALVSGTLKIFTPATRKCHLKGKIFLCAPPVPPRQPLMTPHDLLLTPPMILQPFKKKIWYA